MNPTSPGPLQVILDANDPNYYVSRSSEILRSLDHTTPKQITIDELRKVVTLLTFAKVKLEQKVSDGQANKQRQKKLAKSFPIPGNGVNLVGKQDTAEKLAKTDAERPESIQPK